MKVLYYSLLIVIIDQVSKLAVKGISIPSIGINLKGMPYQSSISIIDDFFMLTFIENPGMAFGIQVGGKLFLSLFTIFATLLILYFIFKNRNESIYVRLALAFILGGALGNLVDRTFYGLIYSYAPIFYGSVVDFFHIKTPPFSLLGKQFYSFPIFNVADISVSTGFVMIILGYNKMFKGKKSEEDLQPAAEGEEKVIVSGDHITEIHNANMDTYLSDFDNDVDNRSIHEDLINDEEKNQKITPPEDSEENKQ